MQDGLTAAVVELTSVVAMAGLAADKTWSKEDIAQMGQEIRAAAEADRKVGMPALVGWVGAWVGFGC